FDKSIADIDAEREKLRQGQEKLTEHEGEFKVKTANYEKRQAEVERHNRAQEGLGSQKFKLSAQHEAELERHNKQVEMNNNPEETDTYIIQSVDPRGNVKPLRLKVRKGEDPGEYVKQFQTTAPPKPGSFPTTIPKPGATQPGMKATPLGGGAPDTSDIQQRN